MTNSSTRFKLRPDVENRPSARLLALLAFTKSMDAEFEFSWEAVPAALAELYHPKMTLSDAMHHLLHAYQELKADPRFEAGNSTDYTLDILLAPVKGSNSIEILGPASLKTAYTVGAFYNAMALHMLGAIRCARIDWLYDLNEPAALPA